jgi:outer membrane protein TolC
LHREHLDVLRGLSEAVRARLSIGAATLADQQQIDLAAARLEDRIAGMHEAERRAEAELRAAVGVALPSPVATSDSPPDATLPAESDEALHSAARAHPRIQSSAHRAVAQEHMADARAADGYPSFAIGADYILTGEARMPGVADSGKDAVLVGATIRVPLWQGNYSEDEAAARAQAGAERQMARSQENEARANLEMTLSRVRDAARRVRIYRDTLLPQADSAYQSVLGTYTTGRGSVAEVLLAQRDLLELRIEIEQARADHARAYAALEQITGRHVERASVESQAAPRGPKP